MQAVVDSKQKIIEAQVPVCLSSCMTVSLPACLSHFLSVCLSSCLSVSLPLCLSLFLPVCLSGKEDCESRCSEQSSDGGTDSAEGALRCDITEERPVS